jgi:hypothetical protein
MVGCSREWSIILASSATLNIGIDGFGLRV